MNTEKLVSDNSRNGVIAEFLGCNLSTDWNLLMTAVDKIEKLGYNVNYIDGDVFIFDNDDNTLVIPNPTDKGEGRQAKYYNIVADFIQWYNAKN